MSIEANGGMFGANPKFALESNEKTDVDLFLEEANIRNPVTISVSEENGHYVSRAWIGTSITGLEVNMQSIMGSKGTGCLRITEGPAETTIFMIAGNVVRERTKSSDVDPRQTRMNI